MSSTNQDQLIVSSVEGLKIDHISRTVRPTLGVRRAGKSGSGIIGTMLDPATYREFGTDSNLELEANLQTRQRIDVGHVQDQPVRTSFVNVKGIQRETIWDQLITLTDGTNELVSVKKLQTAQKTSFRDTFERVCEGVPPGTADRASLFTDANRVKDLVDRGELYYQALLRPKPAAADEAFSFIEASRTPLAVLDVCLFLRNRSAPPEQEHYEALSEDFWTVVWLLAKRRLQIVGSGRLAMSSEVAVA